MIKQSLSFNDILEKKFKILRTSIMLGNLRNREETLSEYEETAREIDKIRSNVYEELLGSKIYTTITLEEEQARLKDLISFIEKRIRERNDFVDDYIKITSNFLDNLDRIPMENELINYRNRYDNILEYFNNCEEIKKLNFKLKDLKKELEEKYESKANNELINSKLEDELIEEFNKFIAKDDYYSELNYTDIDLELANIEESLLDKKSVLDTFTSSYKALVNAGISGAEREEYASYVNDARVNYYEDVDKKFVLNIYKLVLDKVTDYDKLFEKRLALESLLNDRVNVRNELGITKRDSLEYFSNLCKEQFSIIRSQKFNIENIDKLILEISECEARLEKLEKANNRDEIIDLLDEFAVEKVEVEKIEMPEEKVLYEEIIEFAGENRPSNMVVRIKDPVKINVKTASDTAKLVMKKVVIVLEPKKFNSKKDKLKEAEKELKKEKLMALDKEDDGSSLEDNSVIEKEVNESENKNDEVINTIEDTHDIFLDGDPNELGVELDTKEVFGDSSVKETKELTEIKLNASDPSNMTIPTEIFIEDPPQEELDLFKVTDPFLDDNEFELDSSGSSDEIKSIMPTLGCIGTVKPNNALSKIENVVKESEDVLLPNLGLVDDTKVEVPIVSENYIS